MKTVPELAKEIENNPEQAHHLLDGFRTIDHDLRMFLFSLKSVPAQIIPALLTTFYKEQVRLEKRTVLDVIRSGDVGVLFEVKELNKTFIYTGFDCNNNASFVELGKDRKKDQCYLDANMEIKWLF